MTIARHGFYALAAANPALILGAQHDFNSENTEWAQTNVAITTACNQLIVGISWEQNVDVSGVLVRNAADDTTLATLASVGAGEVTGATGQTNTEFYGIFNASGLGINASDTRVEVSFSGNAAGSIYIWRFSDTTRLPTTGDFDSQSGTGLGSVSGSISISGDEAVGFILGCYGTNTNDNSGLTGTGGQTVQGTANTSADGVQMNWFTDDQSQTLTGTETPGSSWTDTGRSAGQWVLVA